MDLPKILVGCPTFDGKEYCLDEFIEGLDSLTYENFDVCLVDTSKKSDYFRKLKKLAEGWNSRKKQKFQVLRQGFSSPEPKQVIVGGRNKLREMVLTNGYDYFLSLEQDVIPPPDFIERLLSRNKDIIAGAYFNFVPELNSLVVLAYFYKNEEDEKAEKTTTLGLHDLFPSRVIEKLRATGVGCILIKKEVLKSIEFRVEANERAFDDWWFCTDAIEKGYSINIDSSMFCKHHYRPWLNENQPKS